MAQAASSVFVGGQLGPTRLRNRIIKCATNEGLSRDGLMTDRLIDWHREFAVGGVAMTTLAYCSVSSRGRTFRHQIWLREEALPGLKKFTNAIHQEDARAAIQLGHAGWFANPRAMGEPPLGPSRQFSPHAQAFSRAATEQDLKDVERDFAEAARIAVRAGFDAVEVHAGHGYLLSQFLCPYNNRRHDRFGGSLENRARFPRRVLRAVREAVGSDVAVYAKLNVDDGFKGGLTLDESVMVARWFEAEGSVDALQLSGGHTTKTPMYLLRGDVPLREMIDREQNWLRRWGMRLLAPTMLKAYRFEEGFFLDKARRFRSALKLPLILLGGVTRLDTMENAVAEGFDFVAMGRGLIRDPDLVLRMRRGELDASRCVPCNLCIVEMERNGVRCVYRD